MERKVSGMDDKEMGRISLILMMNYWIKTAFSALGLTKIDDKFEEISKATGIHLEELRKKYAPELTRRLIIRFDSDQVLPMILDDEQMGRLSLIFVERYWETTPFLPGGLKDIIPKLEEISAQTGIPLARLIEYAAELMKRMAIRFAKQPVQQLRKLITKAK